MRTYLIFAFLFLFLFGCITTKEKMQIQKKTIDAMLNSNNNYFVMVDDNKLVNANVRKYTIQNGFSDLYEFVDDTNNVLLNFFMNPTESTIIAGAVFDRNLNNWVHTNAGQSCFWSFAGNGQSLTCANSPGIGELVNFTGDHLTIDASTNSVVFNQGIISPYGNYYLTLPTDNDYGALWNDGSGNLSWVDVSGGGGGGSGIDTNTQTAGWTDANGYWTSSFRTDKYTSFRQDFVKILDTNKMLIAYNYDPTLAPSTRKQAWLEVSGSLNFQQVKNPSTTGMTLTPEYDTSYALAPGTYGYSIKYETIDGNTIGSQSGSNCVSITLTSQGRVQVNNIPIPTDKRVVYKYLYRTIKDDYATSCTRGRRLARLNVNDTTYVDNTPDTSLPANDTTFRNDNTTGGRIFVNSNIAMTLSNYNTAYGFFAGNRINTGYENVLLGYGAGDDINTGNTNTCIGHASCDGIVEGTNNVMIAPFSGHARNTGDSIIIGSLATYQKNNITFSEATIIGRYAWNGSPSKTTTISRDVVIGGFALYNRRESTAPNTIIGGRAGFSSSIREIGGRNVYIGSEAGNQLAGTNDNILIGHQSGGTSATAIDSNRSICIGSFCVLRGTNSGAIGYGARVDLNNAYVIGGTGSNAVNLGLGTTTPYYPLTIEKDVNGISIYVRGQVSATGYITRTDVYDKTKGKALTQLKDATQLKKTDGTINHEAFGYSYTRKKVLKIVGEKIEKIKKQECTPKGNPTIEGQEPETECTTIEEDIRIPIIQEVEEDAIDLVKEVAMLRQALYELKTCLATANKLDEARTCVQ